MWEPSWGLLDAAFWPVANADTVARAAMLFAIVPTRMLAIGDPEVTGWGSFDGCNGICAAHALPRECP